MCSVFDFIDKQKYVIESQRKTIQTLYEFLDSIDKPNDEKRQQSNGIKEEFKSKPIPGESNGVSNRNYVSNQKIIDKKISMIATNGLLGWISSDKGEQKRRQLAEERRREYNEFLEQKSGVDSRNSERSSKRVTKLIPDYSDILNAKRIEERKLRHSSDYDIEDIEDISDHQLFYHNNNDIKKKTYPEVPTVGWFRCSNNKFDLEHITPRSRLLATHSSRLKAAKYREELKKQVEEKERLKAMEKQRIRIEDEELDHKLESQRIKLLKEFEEEHRLIRQKAEQKQVSEEVNKQLPNRELKVGSTSPLSLLRSPTYMHMKDRQSLNPLPRKSSAVSRSLASALSQTVLPSQSMATQTSDEQKHFTSDESDLESDTTEEYEDEEENEEKSKETEFRQRVLSQLSEVRQMMESDHIKMMEQLRQQQLSQMDE